VSVGDTAGSVMQAAAAAAAAAASRRSAAPESRQQYCRFKLATFSRNGPHAASRLRPSAALAIDGYCNCQPFAAEIRSIRTIISQLNFFRPLQ